VPRVLLPRQLRDVAPLEHSVSGATTVRRALTLVFERYPQLRHCILDERGVLRRRLAVFVDGQYVIDPEHLGDALAEGSCVHVLPALAERPRVVHELTPAVAGGDRVATVHTTTLRS
jgi:molybdopterin synthase sulfur carrier subunit